MSQPDVLENYDHLLDTASMWSPENEALRIREPEDLETNHSVEGIGSSPADSNDNDDNGRYRKRKNSRLTQHQTEKLLAFFEKCPMPSRQQKEELSEALGMTPLQIRFWYQNRRSALRRQRKSHEFTRLKAENERLQTENAKYKETLNTTCLKCSSEITMSERQLVAENARLKEEIARIFSIASKHVRRPLFSHLPSSSRTPYRFQAQTGPIRPTPVPSEERNIFHSAWNRLVNELTTGAGPSNLRAPSYGPHDPCNLTLTITDPQDRTSRSLKSPRRKQIE